MGGGPGLGTAGGTRGRVVGGSSAGLPGGCSGSPGVANRPPGGPVSYAVTSWSLLLSTHQWPSQRDSLTVL